MQQEQITPTVKLPLKAKIELEDVTTGNNTTLNIEATNGRALRIRSVKALNEALTNIGVDLND